MVYLMYSVSAWTVLILVCPLGLTVAQTDPAMTTCATVQCPEGAECVDHGSFVSCECTNGMTGINCTEVDPCVEVTGPDCPEGMRCFGPCHPNVVCLVSADGPQCSGCIDGWTGMICDQKADNCSGSCEKERLNCYECSNLLDPKCGTTWGYDTNSEEAKGYLHLCPEGAVACQKLMYRDSLQGKDTDGVVVTRSCWSVMNDDPYRPNECYERFSGEVCYCLDDNCNGGQLVTASWMSVMLGLALLVFRFLH